ncbi:hypothetical protein [Magnetofaba australis]|uniref:hypothetical protein n=1 Tax=Magnetofaba australis TaxID=1472297 RepID=UPI00117D9263|nr:hypothetical protein [Magnetofaba australis]
MSGYEAKGERRGDVEVEVVVDRPGKDVVLLLSSYDKITWRVSPSAHTRLKYIVLSGYYESPVFSSTQTPLYGAKAGFAYQEEGRRFTKLLRWMKQNLNVTALDGFFGAYGLPGEIVLNRSDKRPQWSLNWPPVKRSEQELIFSLPTRKGALALYDLNGPLETPEDAVMSPHSRALSPDGEREYRIARNGVQVIDQRLQGSTETFDIPANFVRFSWPIGIAYDTHQDIVSIVSFGGDGAFYRFDAKREKWLDFRTFGGVDLQLLAFDPVDKQYVGVTSFGRNTLLFIDQKGAPQERRELLRALPGFSRIVGRDSSSRERNLVVAPQGRYVAIAALDSQHRVGHIWLYDKVKRSGQLTYARQDAM